MILTKEQWKVAITILFMGSIVSMDKNMISMTVLALGDQFQWLPNQTGIIFSVYYIGFTLITIPGGWLVDRFGYRKFILSSLFVLILFSILFSLSHSLIALAMMRMGVGLGHASYTTGTPKIISTNFKEEDCSSIQSKVLATAGIGGVLAFTIGTQLINSNWHAAYWMIAALYSVVWLMMLIFGKEKPQTPITTTTPRQRVSLFDAWKQKNVLFIAFGMVFTNLVASGIISWLPLVLKANFNLTDNTKIGYLLTINSIIMAGATMVAGVLINKYYKYKEKTFITLCSLIAAVCLIGFIFSTHFVVAVLILYVISILLMFVFTAYMVLPYRIVSPAIIGSSFSVINIGAFIGGIIAPILIGNLVTASNGSFISAFIAMSICLILASLVPFCINVKNTQVPEF